MIMTISLWIFDVVKNVKSGRIPKPDNFLQGQSVGK
jgi:hypothetical protein